MSLLFWFLALATFAGFLAPVLPPAEMANHFRQFILFGSGAVAVAAIAAGRPRLAQMSGVLALVNVALVAAPALDAAPAGFVEGRATLRVLSFNAWAWNGDLRAAARYVLSERPDVVLLQELPKRQADKLLPMLRGAYPHVKICDCHNMALLSRRPWIEQGSRKRVRGREPGLIWARFADERGGAYRVIGVHQSYPLRPWDQARDYEWLTAYLSGLDGPVVVAGDFNVTPWSWAMTRLTSKASLRRHGTFERTWPAHVAFPAFLLDNVLTTPDIGAASFRVGPSLGSDHRPITVDLAPPDAPHNALPK